MPVSKITKSSVLRQDKKPSSPTEGLIWYDTQAEVLKQYKNGSFQNVGNSIDGKSITKNQNGELEVKLSDSLELNSNNNLAVRKPADFTSTDLINLEQRDQGTTTETIDLSGVSSVTFTVDGDSPTKTGMYCKIKLDGSTLATFNNGGSFNRTITTDTSNISGQTTVELDIYNENNDYFNNEIKIRSFSGKGSKREVSVDV